MYTKQRGNKFFSVDLMIDREFAFIYHILSQVIKI